jgi:iron(III) transport system permease protein
LMILLWTSLAPPFTTISLSGMSGLNLDAYRDVLNYGKLWIVVTNTLAIAAATAAIGMLIVTLVSWLSTRGRIRGASFPDRLAFVVIGVPGIVLGLALIFIYTAVPLPIYGTIWIIVIALVTTCLPFGTRLMGAAFLQIHPELEEAAATSGAGLWHTFVRIVLPLLWPSFARGFLWMFVRSLSDTTIALMLYAVVNETLGVTLWFLWMEEADFSLASAIAVPLVMVTMALTFLVARQTLLTEGGR